MAVRTEYKVVRKKLADGTIKEYRYDTLTGKPIKAKPGTPSFAGELQRLRTERGEIKWQPGTIGSLIHQYQNSRQWKKLAYATQKNYRLGLSSLAGHEHRLLKDLRKTHLIQMRDVFADRPGLANQMLTAISAIIGWAKESDSEEWQDIEYNVVESVKRMEVGVWKAWTPSALETFEASLDKVTRQSRIAFALLYYTAQRRGDVLKMKWSDYNPSAYGGAGSIRVLPQKTGKTEDDFLEVPVHPRLKEILTTEKPHTKSVFIVHREDGKPYWSDNPRINMIQGSLFSGRFQACQQRVFGKRVFYPIHGLRKAAAQRLAEAGCSIHEIMAITGHKSIAMVAHYTRGAEQKVRSVAAMKKLMGGAQ
jgi:integrase